MGAAAGRVRAGRHRPGRGAALRRAPQRARRSTATLRGRGVAIAERTVDQPAGALRGAGGAAAGRPPAAARAAGAPGAGDPGARRAAAGRRPRGAVGDPRLPVGRGAAGPQPAQRDRGRPGRAAARGARTRCRCRSPGWSPTASTRSARRWRGRCPGCRTSCASSTTCGRRPGRSTRPTGTPRRS